MRASSGEHVVGASEHVALYAHVHDDHEQAQTQRERKAVHDREHRVLLLAGVVAVARQLVGARVRVRILVALVVRLACRRHARCHQRR